MKKKCSKCGLWKDETEFSWRNRRLGLLQSACKECRKKENVEYYQKDKARHRARITAYTHEMREKARAFIWNYLSNSICADCGEYDPMVLEFDHVRGEKKMDISQMVNQGYSTKAIDAEIIKCEVVCCNCHKRREKRRRGTKYW